MNSTPQNAEQITRPLIGDVTTAPDIKFDPTRIPMPVAGKDPIRFAIRGITEKIPELKKIIEAQDFDPDLRAYILSELDELKGNAAEIHLHDVEFGDGEGFDLHLSIRARHLGAKEDAVFRRADPAAKG